MYTRSTVGPLHHYPTGLKVYTYIYLYTMQYLQAKYGYVLNLNHNSTSFAFNSNSFANLRNSYLVILLTFIFIFIHNTSSETCHGRVCLFSLILPCYYGPRPVLPAPLLARSKRLFVLYRQVSVEAWGEQLRPDTMYHELTKLFSSARLLRVRPGNTRWEYRRLC